MWIRYFYSLVLILLQYTVPVLGQSQTSFSASQRCFPAQEWLSCLIGPCAFSVCPSRPDALCTVRRTPCNGCRAAFVVNGSQVDCFEQNRGSSICEPGTPVALCRVNPCTIERCLHREFIDVECRPNFCGTCRAEYMIRGRWTFCPVSDSVLPIDTVIATSPRQSQRQWNERPILSDDVCAPGVPIMQCPPDMCSSSFCERFPEAFCRPNRCGQCRAEWYIGTQLVDCNSLVCPRGVPQIDCVDDPCKYFKCPPFPDATCRPNNCGSCRAEFFRNNTQIDCAIPEPACPNNVMRVRCPANTCRVSICPKNIRAMCHVNNCGSCRAEYYAGDQQVECDGWWSNSRSRGIVSVNEIPEAQVTFRVQLPREKLDQDVFPQLNVPSSIPRRSQTLSSNQNLFNNPSFAQRENEFASAPMSSIRVSNQPFRQTENIPVQNPILPNNQFVGQDQPSNTWSIEQRFPSLPRLQVLPGIMSDTGQLGNNPTINSALLSIQSNRNIESDRLSNAQPGVIPSMFTSEPSGFTVFENLQSNTNSRNSFQPGQPTVLAPTTRNGIGGVAIFDNTREQSPVAGPLNNPPWRSTSSFSMARGSQVRQDNFPDQSRLQRSSNQASLMNTNMGHNTGNSNNVLDSFRRAVSRENLALPTSGIVSPTLLNRVTDALNDQSMNRRSGLSGTSSGFSNQQTNTNSN